MNTQVIVMGIVLIAIIALFLSEKLPLAVTSLVGAVVVGLLGFVPHKEVFTSFASTSMILMISMMIVGSSLFYTGLAQKIGNVLYKFTGGSERSMILIAGMTTVANGVSNSGLGEVIASEILKVFLHAHGDAGSGLRDGTRPVPL